MIGIVIGTASVMPGVSGGTIAIAVGIYDKLIGAFLHIFTDFKNSIRILAPIITGAVVRIVSLSFLIEFMFARGPFQTNMLFIGLILGGLSPVIKQIRSYHFKWQYMIAFFISIIGIIGLSFASGIQGNEVQLNTDVVGMIQLFGVGVIISATLVIPGISGTMVLLVIGYYTPMISSINQFIKAVLQMNFPIAMQLLAVFLPVLAGTVIGSFAIAKLIEMVFRRHAMIAYCGIAGLIIVSPVAILLVNRCVPTDAFVLFTGAAAFVAGYMIAGMLKEEK